MDDLKKDSWLRHLAMAEVIGIVALMCTMYLFLEAGGKMQLVDHWIVLILMLLSGITLLLVPVLEYLLGGKPSHKYFRELCYLSAGLLGTSEAVASLTALVSDNMWLYDQFNPRGLTVLFGAIAIFGTLWGGQYQKGLNKAPLSQNPLALQAGFCFLKILKLTILQPLSLVS